MRNDAGDDYVFAGEAGSGGLRRTPEIVKKYLHFAGKFGINISVMQHSHLELERAAGPDAERLVLQLKGKLSLETVHNFVQTARPEKATHLVVNMSEVSFLDSAGVGALVQLFVHRRGLGKSFALAGLSKQSQAVMEVAGLTKLLPIHNSVEEALAKAR